MIQYRCIVVTATGEKVSETCAAESVPELEAMIAAKGMTLVSYQAEGVVWEPARPEPASVQDVAVPTTGTLSRAPQSGLLYWVSSHSKGAVKSKTEAIVVLLFILAALVITGLNARSSFRPKRAATDPKILARVADEISGKTMPGTSKSKSSKEIKWDLQD